MKVHDYITYEVDSKPLTQLLPQVDHLDLIMIDVEGAELFVIDGLGLGTLHVDWLLIENVSVLGGDERVRMVLKAHGYALCARIASTDDLYEFVGKVS